MRVCTSTAVCCACATLFVQRAVFGGARETESPNFKVIYLTLADNKMIVHDRQQSSDVTLGDLLGGMKPLHVLYGVVAVILLGVLAFAVLQPIKVLPRIGLAPGLGLIDQDGRMVSNEILRGHIVLYNFTYSRCVSPCPQTASVMLAVQERLNASFDNKGFRIRLLTISLDPEYDTPQVLKAFASRSGADRPRWWFATGEAAQLKYAVGGGFNVFYAPDAKGGFTFDPVFVLVDGWGIVRAEYRTATPAVDRILRDIGLVIDEAIGSEGAARYAYETAHLFSCYPK